LTSTLTEVVDLDGDGDVDPTVDVDGLTLDIVRSARRTSENGICGSRSDATLAVYGSRASTVWSTSPSNASTDWVNINVKPSTSTVVNRLARVVTNHEA